MVNGFEINKRGIEEMSKALEREFAKHPVRVPVQVTDEKVLEALPQTNVHNYHGPVIHGDANGAQLAWGNATVSQRQDNTTETIAPGYERLTEAIVALMQKLPDLGLDADIRADAEDSAKEILTETTADEPNTRSIRRALHVLKGILAPLSAGITAGVEAAVRPEVQEWAAKAIGELGQFVA
ncbi:MAG: hypothetical protein HOQ24_13655 [Mycobacteriaceae bacterium]|nr:hypothetical protein [Mycobacteriaceae bacterium]